MGPNYIPGTKNDLNIATIQRTLLIINNKIEPFPDISCGNLLHLVGVDKYILKNATITDDESANCIRSIKFSQSPVVRISVEPKNPQDLPKLIEGLKRLS